VIIVAKPPTDSDSSPLLVAMTVMLVSLLPLPVLEVTLATDVSKWRKTAAILSLPDSKCINALKHELCVQLLLT
jgi:hypothetical protein